MALAPAAGHGLDDLRARWGRGVMIQVDGCHQGILDKPTRSGKGDGLTETPLDKSIWRPSLVQSQGVKGSRRRIAIAGGHRSEL
jgi:hypothetical protein